MLPLLESKSERSRPDASPEPQSIAYSNRFKLAPKKGDLKTPKMLRLIIRFHSDLIVKVSIGGEDVCFDSTTGVKQGCTMAPLLFAIYFQGANEVVSDVLPVSLSLMFKTEKDFVFSGRKVTQSTTAIDFFFDKSLYICKSKSAGKIYRLVFS